MKPPGDEDSGREEPACAVRVGPGRPLQRGGRRATAPRAMQAEKPGFPCILRVELRGVLRGLIWCGRDIRGWLVSPEQRRGCRKRVGTAEGGGTYGRLLRYTEGVCQPSEQKCQSQLKMWGRCLIEAFYPDGCKHFRQFCFPKQV